MVYEAKKLVEFHQRFCIYLYKIHKHIYVYTQGENQIKILKCTYL